jgi:alkylation response protein AidB-like acyl-CoA dehydrogenase
MSATSASPRPPISYLAEHVDALPFGSPDKARRYATGEYRGAAGRNWYDCDPSLQFLVRYYLADEAARWAEPHFRRAGAIMGGPITTLAEQTDRHGPTLQRYDPWGHEIGEVVLPASLQEARRTALDARLTHGETAAEASRRGVSLEMLGRVDSYLLNQADMGLACALGTGADMIENLVNQFAPADVRELLMAKFAAGEMGGETAQLLTERTGGSDLATLETTATPNGDAWLLNGLKWFASNAGRYAYVVLAKPVGAPDTIRSIAPFLVLKERRDGSRNGVRIRRLKEKLGTRSVASAEVEFVDAEAFLLSGPPTDGSAGPSDGRGMARMMSMTNASRLGVAMMGLGCARRALVESICYASKREAFGRRLMDKPLMRRKLAELIVDVEAAQALVFDSGRVPNHQRSAPARTLRLGIPVVKLQAARLGITAATDAIEVHGGNGYIEDWPVARILRDSLANTIWEGTDNILCLDIRRSIEREAADEPFLARLNEAGANAGELPSAGRVARHAGELREAIDDWKALNRRDREAAEAGLFELGQAMGRVYAAALLAEQAAWEQATTGSTRKELIAQLYIDRHLEPGGWRRAVASGERSAMERFDELLAGAFADV